MSKQVKTVLGFCSTHAHAEEAVDKLRLSGFRNTDVCALMRNGGDFQGGVLSWPSGTQASPREAAEHEDWLLRGGILLLVRCANPYWEKRAETILHKTAATAGVY